MNRISEVNLDIKPITQIQPPIYMFQTLLKKESHYYLVPMQRYGKKGIIHLHSLIAALSPKRAMCLAKEEFEQDGWIISGNYENYKEITL